MGPKSDVTQSWLRACVSLLNVYLAIAKRSSERGEQRKVRQREIKGERETEGKRDRKRQRDRKRERRHISTETCKGQAAKTDRQTDRHG